MKPYYEDGSVVIYHGDCREGEPPPTGALAIFDPPYNVGVDYGQGAGADSLPPEEYEALIVSWLRHLQTDTLAWTPGQVNVERSWGWARSAGWTPKRLLGWHKREYAGDLWLGGPAMCWEPVLWAHRGEKAHYERKFGAWGRDFLVVDSTRPRIPHPCPKPPEVYRWLIGLFCPEGGTVIDPTCGSGTSLVEAKNAGRKAVGWDTNEAYCEVAASRCSQEVLALARPQQEQMGVTAVVPLSEEETPK